MRALVPEPLSDDGPDASNCTLAYVSGADDPCQAAKDNCPPFGSVLNYLELRFCTFGGKVSMAWCQAPQSGPPVFDRVFGNSLLVGLTSGHVASHR